MIYSPYFWFKALHLIAMVAWFAGLFYMFRLFVYHTENKDKPDVVAVLSVMERKLYKIIMVPAFIATLVFGIAMLYLNSSWLKAGWFHAKAFLLVVLIGYHHYCNYVRKRFERGDVYLNSVQCRWRNEIPTIILIAVVLLATLKPF
ncbi:MAG: protoporphyrinogen oxidase HemJ [Acidobacteria bacterium]|nr:protoporphyrinogen oxidase HemJ [Acidobacteriota bacterium]MCB9398048.1 protoporphyrinogen oxidase HemJ [Acidobacteriota bacterium]